MTFFKDYREAYCFAVSEARTFNREMQLRAGKEYNTKGFYVCNAIQKPELRFGSDAQGEFIKPTDPRVQS